jgi:DNA polymerase-3 subunit gamma/tau
VSLLNGLNIVGAQGGVKFAHQGRHDRVLQQQRLRGEALEAARERLQQDPVVMALVREFDATLRPDSIQPVQE